MKKKIAEFITKHCYVVFAIFLALAAGCGLLSTKVKINHDIYSYMPADSETAQGLAIMKDEFNYGETSSWQIMFEDLDENQQTEVKNYLESVENIKVVTHENSDEYVKEKDGHTYALYDVVMNAPGDSEVANKTYNEIYKHLKRNYTFYQVGEVYLNNGAVMQPIITTGAIVCAMIVLTFMSESYIEPWLYMFAILIAVILNNGTNIIFPSVSHVTNGISLILQLALSMDYAIMLSSRYRQEKNNPDHPGKKKAMSRALRYSFGAISSSSVTTVVGLLVLIFMSFTIGKDMGLVLSKGVVLSLVSIFTVLPALLLLFDKWIEKTKKKTTAIKMDFLGNQEYKLRKLALPIFALVFGGAFLLKGNTNILYTASENDRIKDVFAEVNQTAVVYDNSLEGKVVELCDKLTTGPSVKRVLCYSNTLGEAKKYDEIITKANELSEIKIAGQTTKRSQKKIEAEDYLVKIIYYYFYRGEKHTMTLTDFVRFIQNEVIASEEFSDEIDDEMQSNIERLAKFVLPEEAEKSRSKYEIAEILGVSVGEIDDLYTLYLAKHPTGLELKLYDFAVFVNNEILTNPEYAGMVSNENRASLEKLLIFSNPAETNYKRTPAELAEVFSLPVDTVEALLTYYNYTISEEPVVAVSPEGLMEFALSNEMLRDELGISAETAGEILNLTHDVREAIEPYIDTVPGLRDALDFLAEEYTYEDYVNFAQQIEAINEMVREKASEINETYNLGLDNLISNIPTIDLSVPLEKVRQVYQVYQTTTLTKSLSVAEFVDFLIEHASDARLNLDTERVDELRLAQYVILNQETYYSADELASAFSLDLEQLRLVYALYDYRYVTGDLWMSVEEVIRFLTDEVFVDANYTNRFSDEQKDEVRNISELMRTARAGTMFSYDELYLKLSLFSRQIERDQLFLIYLYHGSIYDYDENFTMTIEEFVEFLNEKILPDVRFSERISDEMRSDIIEAKTTVMDAKKMLVGEKHSRFLVETYLPAEGKETFEFMKSLKDELGQSGNYLTGNSAVAYEMSLSFAEEMDHITILTMIAIFAVVAITFRSILISLLLVLIIQAAVYINMAYLSLTGQSVLFLAIIIVQSILMGATIDYAILFTSYYLEQRKYYELGVKDALIASYNKSIHSILTSASILIIVTAIVGNFALAIAAKICQSIAGGTFVSTIIILVLLPAMLATLDSFIVKQKK